VPRSIHDEKQLEMEGETLALVGVEAGELVVAQGARNVQRSRWGF
jgi:hypothetical protein